MANNSFENAEKFKLFWDDDNSSELYACRNQMQTKCCYSVTICCRYTSGDLHTLIGNSENNHFSIAA